MPIQFKYPLSGSCHSSFFLAIFHFVLIFLLSFVESFGLVFSSSGKCPVQILYNSLRCCRPSSSHCAFIPFATSIRHTKQIIIKTISKIIIIVSYSVKSFIISEYSDAAKVGKVFSAVVEPSRLILSHLYFFCRIMWIISLSIHSAPSQKPSRRYALLHIIGTLSL